MRLHSESFAGSICLRSSLTARPQFELSKIFIVRLLKLHLLRCGMGTEDAWVNATSTKMDET